MTNLLKFRMRTDPNRGYSMDGVPLTEPAEWFGRNEIERGSGAIFPIPLLIDLYHLTGNYAYYESARKAASFILKTYVANVYYIGGINDTSHKKSVKMDAASVMFVMRSLLVMYEETKEQEFLEGAVKAAKFLLHGPISGMCLTMKIHFWANMDLRLRDGPFAMQSQQEAMWIVHSLKLYQNLCVSQSCLRSRF